MVAIAYNALFHETVYAKITSSSYNALRDSPHSMKDRSGMPMLASKKPMCSSVVDQTNVRIQLQLEETGILVIFCTRYILSLFSSHNFSQMGSRYILLTRHTRCAGGKV